MTHADGVSDAREEGNQCAICGELGRGPKGRDCSRFSHAARGSFSLWRATLS